MTKLQTSVNFVAYINVLVGEGGGGAGSNSRILQKQKQPLHRKDIQLIFIYRMSEYRLI